MTDKEYEEYKAYENRIFNKGIKIISVCGGSLMLGVLAFLLFWPTDSWTQDEKTSTAWIALLILFLPMFALIFFIQGHTLWSMDRWNNRKK